jgi:hypothetical protein
MSTTTSFWTQEVFWTRIDNYGNILPPFFTSGRYVNASHPLMLFNKAEEEYLLALNDYHPSGNQSDNLGFILDEDGNKLNQTPFLIGTPFKTQYNPQGAYKSKDNTYLAVWEDFRYVQSISQNCDLYGALLDADGNMITEIPIIDDFGTPDEGSQNNQNLAYNPDENEFLVAWGDSKRPSDPWGGIMGRILNGDGTPKGEPFVIANAFQPQNSPQMVYLESTEFSNLIFSFFATQFSILNIL